jgi:hypothetical protein
MHIASVGIFEGPVPAYPAISSMIESKLGRVPRYRRTVRHVPLELGRPIWVDDQHFNLEYHLRHTALPSPGGVADLRKLVGRVMSQPLDRSKPLWEMWIVEGLEEGRWALLCVGSRSARRGDGHFADTGDTGGRAVEPSGVTDEYAACHSVVI